MVDTLNGSCHTPRVAKQTLLVKLAPSPQQASRLLARDVELAFDLLEHGISQTETKGTGGE